MCEFVDEGDLMGYFEDYSWCEPEAESQADQIVSSAIEQLKDLVSDSTKATMKEYQDLEARKIKLQREVNELEYKKNKSKEELKDQIALYERMDEHDLPKGFVNKIVGALIGDFKIGDDAWTIEAKYESSNCPMCHGKGLVSAKINGSTDFDIKCPKCSGYKTVSNLSYYAQKRKIARFDIRLNFNNFNRMWVTDEDHIVFCDGDYNRCVNGLYKTEQEAIDAAAKKNAEVSK